MENSPNKELITAATQINDNLKQSEKFPLPLLAVRAKKAALENPSDQSLRMLANVFSKMSENGRVFINRAEFKKLCSAFDQTHGVKICFAEELDLPKEKMQRKIAGQEEINQEDIYKEADQTLVNALSGMWDNSGKKNKAAEYNLYNPNIAKKANMVTNLELSRLGVCPKTVNTFAGTETLIICDASYETPKGEAHILIPVELSKSGIMIPTLFVNKYGLIDLTKEAVETHITNSAGKSFIVNSEALLNALSVAKQMSSISEFELKVLAIQERINNNKITKQAFDQNQMPFASNGVFMQEVDSNKKENVILTMPQAKDFEKFASSLNSSKGIAEFVFGKSIVETGRQAIQSKIASFGYNSQISVLACDDEDNTITYAVKLDTGNGPVGFEVMAEVVNNKAVVPAIVAISDKAYDFTKNGLDKIAKANDTDYKAVAAVSPLYELKSSEILENIRQAANSGDFKTAEEGLTVLAEKADKEVYNTALMEYMRSISASTNKSLQKQASIKSRCTRIVKNASHSVPLCGHCNLPLDKVYQNEHGECVPLYRKQMPDTYEGVLLNTSKIFG